MKTNNQVRRAVIVGVGSYLPERVVTNDDLAKFVDTSDEWIRERTGIKQRHIAADGETTCDLAVHAAQRALEDAGMAASDIDLIVLATSTPDNTFPATATLVQARLGITQGSAFDIQAVCSGFVFALNTANALVITGQANNVLVIGAETFSRILDWEDRGTCVLFGDGAGAVVLSGQNGSGDNTDRGILAAKVRSDGRHYDKLFVDGGVSSTQTVGKLRMQGPEVFKHAVKNISSIITETAEIAGISVSDVDWFVPHQANKRILDGTARKLKLDPDQIVITVDMHGNTSAASVPLALDIAVKDGRIKKGDLVLLEAMGGGFTWGAVLVRW
ncbi:3-oxoacyl-[acyl-carrier-protein] synthase, KASIII [hydrothermal vent metagenome]|uniref:beta-ketoacyl-[acyl-carrier-protein] synthase III n=1 Tax=hydrothermal vent metagenome TaxID=652676 RepID=A0A3B0REZ8_9ZZZZ